jgi:hypothetical protein
VLCHRPHLLHLHPHPEGLWKFSWFLRDFGYETELFGWVFEKAVVGLCGVVKICHVILNGTSVLNLWGFAPPCQALHRALSGTAGFGRGRSGAAASFLTGKKHIKLPAETLLTFKLAEPVTVDVKG